LTAAATDQYVLLRAFVDELVRCGLRDACTSPGSRNTPIVLSLVGDGRLRCHSHIDERAAGFFALGAAKASGRPTAVTCTSGTAAAELLPAVIEAREARVPMLVLTADRPPELREVGAGQTIDQLKLYGDAAKWFFEVGPLELAPARVRWMRTLACRAYATAAEGRPGVVHLNFPLHEPLVTDEPLPDDATGRPEGAPYVRRRPAPVAGDLLARTLGDALGSARRGAIVAGRHERATALGRAAAALAQATAWPLLADPLSGARRGGAAIAHYDALLRDPGFADAQRPDVVLRVGDLPPSKPLRTWLAGLGDVPQVALDPDGAWQDPDAVLAESLAVDPALALRSLLAARRRPTPADAGWLAAWRRADERAAAAIGAELAGAPISEPAIAAELGRLLPASATLFVASSMPVRDVETFWPVLDDPPRVLCNRAANGIDGTVSSALGAAAGGDGPVVLLIGDVALAHDLGGLIAATRAPAPIAVVLLDNGGGGIFDFLPVARSALAPAAIYEEHVATPTGLDFALAARLGELAYEAPANRVAFRVALERALAGPGSSLIAVRTSRPENVALHGRIWAAVAAAIRDAR